MKWNDRYEMKMYKYACHMKNASDIIISQQIAL